MARDYARIMTAIWDNAEFCKLDEAAQRAYLLLVTQPDISAAGVLRMWVPRWAQMARNTTPESLTQALKELEANRFIVLDWTTGELLVRSFVRWDAGFNNPKRKPVIVRAGHEVRSEVIKEHLRFEFKRCGLVPDSPPDPPRTPNGPGGGRHAGSLSDADLGLPRADPGPEPFPQVDSLSHALHDSQADAITAYMAPEKGVVVTQLSTENTATHNPQTPVPPTAGDGPADFELVLVEAAPTVTAYDATARWAEGFATTGNRPVKRLREQVGKEAKELLAAGNDPQRVLDAAYALGCKGRATLVTELAIQTADTGRHLKAVSGGYQSFRNATDDSVWDEPLLPGGNR